jgi:hypothetical protein
MLVCFLGYGNFEISIMVEGSHWPKESQNFGGSCPATGKLRQATDNQVFQSEA